MRCTRTLHLCPPDPAARTAAPGSPGAAAGTAWRRDDPFRDPPVRRRSAPGTVVAMSRRSAISSLVVGGLVLAVSVASLQAAAGDRGAAPAGVETAAPAPAADPLDRAVTAAQQRLAEVPGDHVTWAQLGVAYVEQARRTADPSFYDKAQG